MDFVSTRCQPFETTNRTDKEGNNDLKATRQLRRYGRVMLTGATSYPLPGEGEVKQQDSAPSIAGLEAQGAISRSILIRQRAR